MSNVYSNNGSTVKRPCMWQRAKVSKLLCLSTLHQLVLIWQQLGKQCSCNGITSKLWLGHLHKITVTLDFTSSNSCLNSPKNQSYFACFVFTVMKLVLCAMKKYIEILYLPTKISMSLLLPSIIFWKTAENIHTYHSCFHHCPPHSCHHLYKSYTDAYTSRHHSSTVLDYNLKKKGL